MLDKLNERDASIAYVHGDAVPKKGRHFKKMTFDLPQLKDRKIIFLMRDPRDTVVSAYYDALHRDKIFDKGMTQFIKHPRFGIQKVLRFHQICYENRSLVAQNITLTYEELKDSTDAEMQRVMGFLDWDVSDEKLHETIEFCSFKNMKEMEETGKFKDNRYDYALSPGNVLQPDSYKVRKGKVGGYMEELSKEDLNYCNEMMEKYPSPFYKL